MRVAVLDDYQKMAHGFADWRSLDAEVTFLHDHIAGIDDLADALRDYDAVVAMRERTPFTEELFERLPRLRLLVTTGPVNAAIDLQAAQRHGVTVCGTGGTPYGTSELTWGLIISLVRQIPLEDAAVRAGHWQRTIGGDLHGSTLGVVGLGRIGTQITAVAKAFGMRVLAWSSNLDPEAAREIGAEPVGKQELFSQSDVVTVHYGLSERSTGLVGRQELSWMKKTSYLVNTSRGPIVDTEALIEALREGRIAGAALDVYDREPLPADDPLRTAPRTILTPHIGYVTENAYRIFFEDAVEDIAAFAAGTPLRTITA